MNYILLSGQPSETGPKSEGWVEVIENNISFGFDITRVMFCSGNCTERMRMGREVRIRIRCHVTKKTCDVEYRHKVSSIVLKFNKIKFTLPIKFTHRMRNISSSSS